MENGLPSGKHSHTPYKQKLCKACNQSQPNPNRQVTLPWSIKKVKHIDGVANKVTPQVPNAIKAETLFSTQYLLLKMLLFSKLIDLKNLHL